MNGCVAYVMVKKLSKVHGHGGQSWDEDRVIPDDDVRDLSRTW